MKKSILLVATLIAVSANAQSGRVGINTENPKATLHIAASPDDATALDGVIPPKMAGDQLKAKNYTAEQEGAIVYVTSIPTNLDGQVINVSEPGYYFFDGTIWKSFEEDTLESVVTRGNYSPRYISFLGSTANPLRDGALGMNPVTYSMYFGNMNPNQTGIYNLGFGYGAFQSITTAIYGTSVGSMSGQNITTGNANSFFGDEVAVNMTTGHKNTISGMGAAYHTVGGRYNSIFGFKAGQFRTVGDYNVMLGNNAGSNRNTAVTPIGSNNVLIGSGAGFADGNLNNKLVIHSNNSLTTANSNSPATEGIYSDPGQSQLANALVTGDFQERWFKLNGNLKVNPTYNTSDATYTKTLVAKPDGTVGLADAPMIPTPPAIGSYTLISVNGLMQWVAN